jgi:hypothetical protein
MYLKAFTPTSKPDDGALAGNILYTNKKWTLGMQTERVGVNYNAEVGYVPRLNYGKINPQIGYLFFPKASSKLVLSHGPLMMFTHFLTKDFSKETDNEKFLAYRINFRKTSTLMGWIAHNYVLLLNPFDPTNYAGKFLPKDSQHRWNSFGFDYTSKPQSRLTYAISTRYGGYYARGTRLRLNADLSYRFQPYVAITMSANYNQLDFKTDPVLPKELVNQQYNFWLFGPRIDVTFTNKLFFTNFLQYNNQNNTFNLNTRLQWRYSPASDLFLVYTDNYYSDTFQVRNRALVLKFTYWWNV